jgi:hypothetical protein
VKAEVTDIATHVQVPVHDNEYYEVWPSPELDTYLVTNKFSGVIEFRDPQFANAVSYAEHGNSFIINELWKWVSVQGAKNKEALDSESSVIEFTPDMDHQP